MYSCNQLSMEQVNVHTVIEWQWQGNVYNIFISIPANPLGILVANILAPAVVHKYDIPTLVSNTNS